MKGWFLQMSNVYEKATAPTLYFIGVTTGQSSIMKVFPKWAEALGLKDPSLEVNTINL